MEIVVRNQAQIANKYVRFAKWKLRKLNEQFNTVVYSEIFIKKEASSPDLYSVTVILGVPGPDIILSEESTDLKVLWSHMMQKTKRQMRKYNERTKQK